MYYTICINVIMKKKAKETFTIASNIIGKKLTLF